MTNGATIEQQEGDVVNIGGQRFEVVDEFVYLGALMRADNDNTLEIKKENHGCTQMLLWVAKTPQIKTTEKVNKVRYL